MSTTKKALLFARRIDRDKHQPKNGYVCIDDEGCWCGTVHVKVGRARECNQSGQIIELASGRPASFVKRKQRTLL